MRKMVVVLSAMAVATDEEEDEIWIVYRRFARVESAVRTSPESSPPATMAVGLEEEGASNLVLRRCTEVYERLAGEERRRKMAAERWWLTKV
ncbi:hypothetical protein ACLOJK_003796 [Asimina triloba]